MLLKTGLGRQSLKSAAGAGSRPCGPFPDDERNAPVRYAVRSVLCQRLGFADDGFVRRRVGCVIVPLDTGKDNKVARCFGSSRSFDESTPNELLLETPTTAARDCSPPNSATCDDVVKSGTGGQRIVTCFVRNDVVAAFENYACNPVDRNLVVVSSDGQNGSFPGNLDNIIISRHRDRTLIRDGSSQMRTVVCRNCYGRRGSLGLIRLRFIRLILIF
jgi:hypothetical protein